MNPTSTPPLGANDVLPYLPLVHRAAAGFLRKLPRNILRDDLVSAGTWGLIDSLRKNGRDRGPAFEAYARIRIRGAMVDELRSQDWLSRNQRRRAGAQDASGAAPAVIGVVGLDDLGHERWASFFPGSLPSPLEALECSAARESMAWVLEHALSDREREIVVGHYFQGMDFQDIADQLGVTASRVSQLHSRAMAKLRAALSSAASDGGSDQAAE